jgi:hypothetical protein
LLRGARRRRRSRGSRGRRKDNAFIPNEIGVLTLRGTQIEDITIFRDPRALARFGLPDRIRQ